jgi:hypothetical protein
MNRRGAFISTAFWLIFLGTLAANAGPVPGDAGQEKVTTRIIIRGDCAIVNGDTVDLDKLADRLGRTSEVDVTVQKGGEGGVGGEEVTRKRNEIVKFGGDVRVDEDEKIMGSVVVFGGSAEIAGVVTEDVVVFGGDLVLDETADVRGSAVCFGGTIERSQGAKIGDQEVSLGGFPFNITAGPWIGHHGMNLMMARGIGIFAGIVLIGLVLLLGAGIIFFFPRSIDRVTSVIGAGIIKSGLVGLLGEIMVLPVILIVSLILLVSIIGIPLLFIVVPLGILGLVVALFMGYIGAGVFTGRKVGERASLQLAESSYKVMIVGLIALLSFNILAGVVGLTGDTLWPVVALLKAAGCIVTYLAVTIGFGAVILTRFGTSSEVVPCEPQPN